MCIEITLIGKCTTYFDQNYGNLFGTTFPIPVISPSVYKPS